MNKTSSTPKLAILIELDLSTEVVTVESNVTDPSVMMRIIGQAMHIWANERMVAQVKAIAAASNGKRLQVMLPPRRTE